MLSISNAIPGNAAAGWGLRFKATGVEQQQGLTLGSGHGDLVSLPPWPQFLLLFSLVCSGLRGLLTHPWAKRTPSCSNLFSEHLPPGRFAAHEDTSVRTFLIILFKTAHFISPQHLYSLFMIYSFSITLITNWHTTIFYLLILFFFVFSTTS